MAILKMQTSVSTEPISPCEILKKQTFKAVPGRKRVTFAEHKNFEYPNRIMNSRECKTLWYTPFDFQKMKENVNTFSKQALKQDRARADSDKSYSNIILRIYDECCNVENECNTQASILGEADEKDLVFLVGRANSRTGLERVIVRDLAYDKKCRRQQIVAAVLKIQKRAYPSDATTEFTRLTCASISRPSRYFAKELAGALEVSLR